MDKRQKEKLKNDLFSEALLRGIDPRRETIPIMYPLGETIDLLVDRGLNEREPELIPSGFPWSNVEREILQALYFDGLSRQKLANKITAEQGQDISESAIRDSLLPSSRLRKKKYVQSSGRGRSAYYYRPDAPPRE